MAAETTTSSQVQLFTNPGSHSPKGTNDIDLIVSRFEEGVPFGKLGCRIEGGNSGNAWTDTQSRFEGMD